MDDISQVPTPSSTRVNLEFSTSVRLFSQIVCQFVCIFHYFETLLGPLEGILLVVQVHKIVLTSVTLPRGAVLSYLLPIFVFCYFLNIPFFLENHSIASNYFYRCSWYCSEGYLTNETFLKHLRLCWEEF